MSEEVVRGLHIHKNKEYSNSLTIAHLMSLTSGLPDYLTDKQANGQKAMAELKAGIDQSCFSLLNMESAYKNSLCLVFFRPFIRFQAWLVIVVLLDQWPFMCLVWISA